MARARSVALAPITTERAATRSAAASTTAIAFTAIGFRADGGSDAADRIFDRALVARSNAVLRRGSDRAGWHRRTSGAHPEVGKGAAAREGDCMVRKEGPRLP